MTLEQVERVVRVLQRRELDVGLVEEDRDVARQLAHEGVDHVGRQRSGGRVVGIVDDHDARSDSHLACHRLQVVLAGLAQRDRDRAGARHRRHVRVDRERGPRIDDLGAGLEHRVGGREQQLAGAVADRDPARRHAGALREALAQRRLRRVGIAVEAAQAALDRLEHLRVRGKRRLVRGELHELALELIGRGRRVDRDVGDVGVELDAGAHCACSKSRRSASASRRYTWRASVSGSA